MATGKLAYDELFLWYLEDPGVPRIIGTLRPTTVVRGVSLQYSRSWVESGFALSEDLPLRDIEYRPREKDTAAGAVDDARPDRWGERVIEYVDAPVRKSLMEYLYYAGHDRFGALGVSTSGNSYEPSGRGPLPRLEDAQTLSEIVAKINDKQKLQDVEKAMLRAGGSFGGAKPKALITIEGSEWVIKFSNGEPVDVPLIEHASMTLARLAGITTAVTRPIRLTSEHALAVGRFDRDGMHRKHCISAGTALRAAALGSDKAELGYGALAELLRRNGRVTRDAAQKERTELFRRMVFNILIDNTDDHEKNHALYATNPRALSLAPAYDVLPTNSGQGRQEFIVGDSGAESTIANALTQCERFGLSDDGAVKEVQQVVRVVDGWVRHFREAGVSESDIESLAETLDGDELEHQRNEYRDDNDIVEPDAGYNLSMK